ncbi:hypothetical protein AKJ64_04730 [candidate division MSBL1 archaeon SCGC-AAA259E17]|uniref:SpoVT-AbrB domain-containing protein n=1 Tax=candidate division MSBL1 archaeon SCGC-AAA259E17 TaxID=1698263 RepID=A0A133UB86_9EURY|nr:hypothetical protein AKJ64_04730 [candidate division MSBL1 archaeon SCGC-AAA259E17]
MMKDGYKITEKRQVTLPDDVLEVIGAGPGDKVTYKIREDGVLVRKSEGTRPDPEEIVGALRDLSEDLSQIEPEIRKAREGLNRGIAERVRGEG